MAISAYILKIVEKDPFLRLQMRAKEDFTWYLTAPSSLEAEQLVTKLMHIFCRHMY